MDNAANKINNFDLLRLLAALQVFVGHSILELKLNIRIPVLYFFPGVLIFFTISGFLIFQSLQRNPDLKQYSINRFLRIYPALIVCFIVTLFLLLLFNVIQFSDLFSLTLIKWIFTQLTFFQFWTPEMLRSWGVGTPNGSLWTIPVEIQFYILLPILVFTFSKIKLIYKFSLCIILSICANFLLRYLEHANSDSLLIKLFGVSIFPYLCFFLTGSVLSLYWKNVKRFIEGKALYWLIIFFAFIFIFRVWPRYQPVNIFGHMVNILLSILTISLAYTKPKFSKLLLGLDISYGIYIYHRLIINSFVELGYIKNNKYLGYALILTLVFAILSWFLIEKRALNYKKGYKVEMNLQEI